MNLPSRRLLRELAAFNRGLCVITTRLPVVDVADHERTSALRRDLEQLSNDAGAKLLRALGVKGHEAALRNASEEFRGHCLALTLLGSYLTDAYNGDIRCRKEVSEILAHDVRQGAHARKVMESYQAWFGEGPEVSVLRMLGLFDRPADEQRAGRPVEAAGHSGSHRVINGFEPDRVANASCQVKKSKAPGERRPAPPGRSWTRIHSCANTSAISSGANARKLGRNAISVSIVIIERFAPLLPERVTGDGATFFGRHLRLSGRVIPRRAARGLYPQELSAAMLPSRLTSSGHVGPCFQL